MTKYKRLPLTIDRNDRRPAFVQIVAAVADQIRAGWLRSGDRLPSSRSLARELGTHRNTVISAFQELVAQGWIIGVPGRGTFVSPDLPEILTGVKGVEHPSGSERRPGFLLPHPRPKPPYVSEPPPPGVISLARNVPDPRLFPTAELARAYRRAMIRGGGALLDYGDERGHPKLRTELANLLNNTRGLHLEADDVLVTSGSQMALFLLARAIVPSKGVVAVEALGYSLAWEAFRTAGARVVPIPVDDKGLRVDRLEALLTRQRVHAVYVTPHHQYPTTVVLAAERRLQLLEVARRERMAIIEDDYDHEVHFDGQPVLPLASADRFGVVMYVGSLSKVIAPGVRIGYVVGPRPVIDRMAALRRAIDRHGDPALEYALADLLEDGVLQRHARRIQRTYRDRRDALVDALHGKLPDVLSFRVPAGGMALWACVRGPASVEAWTEAAFSGGVAFPPGRVFAFDGRRRSYTRLSFALHEEEVLREAVERMAASLPEARSQ